MSKSVMEVNNTENANEENGASGYFENEEAAKISIKVFRKRNKSEFLSCSFCFDNTRFITGSKNGETCIWDVDSGQVLQTFKNHNHYVTQCKIFYENSRILSSSYDTHVCVSDVETGHVIWKSKHQGLITSSDISPDGKTVVSCSDFDYSLNFYDFRDGNPINVVKGQHESTPLCCRYSKDGKRVATCGIDCKTKIFDIVSNQTTVTLEDHTNVVSHCEFSKNQSLLATTSWDKTVRLWDISTGQFRTRGSKVLYEGGHLGCVSCCEFTKDDRTLVSGGYDETICVWDVTSCTKQLNLKGHKGWVNSIETSSDGNSILSASSDGTVRLWNVEDYDKIPVVQMYKIKNNHGLVKCKNCDKTYLQTRGGVQEFDLCIFCRIADFEL